MARVAIVEIYIFIISHIYNQYISKVHSLAIIYIRESYQCDSESNVLCTALSIELTVEL